MCQTRGLAFDDEYKLKPTPIEVVINVSSEMGLRFCPFCGQKLADMIKHSPDHFRKLASQHKKYRTMEADRK